MVRSLAQWLSMSLPARLIALRRKRGLTQSEMAEAVGIHPNSWKQYETGKNMPSLDALKKIAVTLNVSTDFLLFEDNERGASPALALQFEAVSQLPENEQAVVKEVLESLIIKYQTRRWDTTRSQAKLAG
jgi:transcriptional regulator with XRE-family HTH domain